MLREHTKGTYRIFIYSRLMFSLENFTKGDTEKEDSACRCIKVTVQEDQSIDIFPLSFSAFAYLEFDLASISSLSLVMSLSVSLVILSMTET
jgi:hypothetical protein